ncbi:MAG: HAMP domain-containing histidine kinase [Deltaproteobacteria bacterium]|nr:HAMP domain-containing histidine kinase [Deltaproteobacteria bacterium]
MNSRPASWRRVLGWLWRIRVRLLLVHLLLVAVPIAGIGFARFFEREMLAALETDMVHQALVLKAALLADPTGLRLAERAPLLVAAVRTTRSRIRLLDARGLLQADSHANGPPEGGEPDAPHLVPIDLPATVTRTGRVVALAPSDLAARPEIRKAVAGHYGAATRVWRNGNRVFLFSAVPMLRDGHVVGVVYLTRSSLPVLQAMHRLRGDLWRVLVVAVLATGVLSLLFAATIARPLERLTRTARRIAAGDLTESLALERKDEIGELARALDEMRQRLADRPRELAELAARMSHEFKSPLTSLRGATELLLEGAADDPAARERFLRNMLADSSRLDRLVTRLLELSRLQADDGPRERVDLGALLRDAAAPIVGQPDVAVAVTAQAPFVLGRAAQLGSALRNLIDNARQHCSPGGRVTATLVDGPGGTVEIAVHNDATISPSTLPRVWERFFTTRGSAGGTGLGLAIVRAAVEGHGGTVGVQSAQGEGTRFWLQVPRA